MTYKNLVLIGSSHIARQSVKEIEENYQRFRPSIIAIELDADRLKAIFSKNREKPGIGMIKKVGFKGFIFATIGKYVSEKLGKTVGMEPGADMKKAALIAKENNLQLELIDQHIQVTLRRFSEEFTWREKMRFFLDMVKMALFRKREMKEWGIEDLDLSKVPETLVIERMMKHMKKRYPSIYKVLIEERNKVMADRLLRLMKKNEDKIILAVIGAGHYEGILKLIKQRYNFIDYSKHRIDNVDYSFSFNYNKA